jgi:HKD family nuclease
MKRSSEIINNLTRVNHFQRLVQNFEKADEILIISPFIFSSINFFPFEKFQKLRQITLVTTLKPNDIDQYNKVPFFKALYEKTKASNIELTILIENSLHGKIYISKGNDGECEAIITSANFTKNGLRLNNEWGTTINETEKIKEIEDGIMSKVVLKPLTEIQIDEFLRIIEANPNPKIQKSIKLDLSKQLKFKENPLLINDNVNYWLKPIGVTNDLISWDRVFDEVDSDLHFSKLRPKGVKKNDILIAYAVGHLNILSIYKVKSEVKNTGNINDRWPYYVIGENLTPFYGQNWNVQNINVTNQKNDFLKDIGLNITPSGKNSYGSLMRGADKLRLTTEFGKYIINKILEIDNELKTRVNNE